MDLHAAFMNLLITMPVFLLSLSVHEAAHAAMALRCGDDTAYSEGRVTINPIPHIDIIGTLLMPTLSIFTGGFAFIGWAKPVPVDWRNLNNPRRDDTLIALAGPASNIVLSLIFLAVLAGVLYSPLDMSAGSLGELLMKISRYGVMINVSLAVFNMIPIPPLDGSHVVANALPHEMAEKYQSIAGYGFFILLFIMNVPAIRQLFSGIIRSILSAYFSVLV